MEAATAPKKVLLVEDDLLISDILARKLTQSGVHVLHAASGDAAFTILTTETPDLILLDLILPGMDGFEILKKLKADPVQMKIPVIILSNIDDQEKIDQAKALGAIDYMVKISVPLEEVVKRVKNVCSM